MLDERFMLVHHRLNGIALDVSALKNDITFLKREMATVREGISILLKRSEA